MCAEKQQRVDGNEDGWRDGKDERLSWVMGRGKCKLPLRVWRSAMRGRAKKEGEGWVIGTEVLSVLP